MGKKSVQCIKRVRKYFKEYCNSTSIHGFRYFGEKRTNFERIWWFIVFVICLSVCGYFIMMVYNKWEDSPVIVSFSTKETPIYQIPFPAVTICPETKTNKALYSHSDIIKKLTSGENLTLEEYKSASYMDLICEFGLSEALIGQGNYFNTSFNSSFYGNDFFQFLNNVTPTPPVELLECRWMNKNLPCRNLFQTIVTDEGICITFNMLADTDIYPDNVLLPELRFNDTAIEQNVTWNLDNGYEDNDAIYTYPRRALFSGVRNALDIILLDRTENQDHACKLAVQGFKVSLHTPMRVPRPSQQYFSLPLNEIVLAAVQPEMITTSETVKNFSPEKRECYFPNEKSLKYFKRYSQRNCNLECLTDFTNDWCWCVNFFMPRENGTDICGTLNKECMEEAENILQQGSLSKLLNKRRRRRKSNSTDSIIDELPDCDCLPLCTDLSYNVETSASRFEWINMFSAVYNKTFIDEEIKNTSISRLTIYFKNSQFVTSKRHELYGPTEFLGNFGGLLGLFTGFSILSFMEIIYFLTVRIFCNIRLYGSWSGHEK